MANPISALTIGVVVWATGLIAPRVVTKRFGFRQPESHVLVHSRSFKTADGTKLVSDVYLPADRAKAPTVLVRIPFSTSVKNCVFENMLGRAWAARGYAVVIQGTRGRFKSEGAFYPLITERQDGIETLTWLAKQPWYNGTVLTWGGSAFGQTQWVISDQIQPGPKVDGNMVCEYSFLRCVS